MEVNYLVAAIVVLCLIGILYFFIEKKKNKPNDVVEEIPDIVNVPPGLPKKWTEEDTTIALYIARYRAQALGGLGYVSYKVKRTSSSFNFKITLFESMLDGNTPTKATRLDKKVFQFYVSSPERYLFDAALKAIITLMGRPN